MISAKESSLTLHSPTLNTILYHYRIFFSHQPAQCVHIQMFWANSYSLFISSSNFMLQVSKFHENVGSVCFIYHFIFNAKQSSWWIISSANNEQTSKCLVTTFNKFMNCSNELSRRNWWTCTVKNTRALISLFYFFCPIWLYCLRSCITNHLNTEGGHLHSEEIKCIFDLISWKFLWKHTHTHTNSFL